MITISLSDRKLTYEYFYGVLETASKLLELRSNETGEQCFRLERIADRIGRSMNLEPTDLRNLVCGALVHDVGKVGIEDAILHKPGNLTDEEREKIKQHVDLGVKTLRKLRMPDGIIQIAAQHHERMDGHGYPAGLLGNSISLPARIFTVCDSYDAMVSDRCYRAGRTHHEAAKELLACMGSQFDPDVIKAFMSIKESEFTDFEKVSWQ